MRLLLATLVCVLALAVTACADGSSNNAPDPRVTVPATSASGLAIIPVRFGSKELRVEVAVTPDQRAVGLSGRDILELDGGMLFDLGATRVPSLWMKDTHIPLDMIWIDADRRVAQITADVQPQPGIPDAQLSRYSPSSAVRYALEVNAGTAARLGLQEGDQLEFRLPGE